MESQPIPIEELKSGEFYDIQSSDENPRFLGALLLEQLPNNQAKLMLLTSSFNEFTTSDFDHYVLCYCLTIRTMQLGLVYPYLTFTHLPDQILHWCFDIEGEGLITIIKDEMYRVVSECCWTFNLPHFCEGYLQVYFSYIAYQDNTPTNKGELLDLWFNFMCSYFSVLRDYFLQVQVLSEKNTSGLLEARKIMEQLSERSWEIEECLYNSSFTLKAMKLADMKKSCFDTYRPIELYPGSFDRLWELTSRQYREDLPTDQIKEPWNLRTLFCNSHKLFEILTSYPAFAKYLMELNIQELPLEEILRVRFRIAVVSNLLHDAAYLIESSEISVDESPRIILEDESVLLSCSEKLQDLVITRADLVPLVLAYLKRLLQGSVKLSALLKYVIARIVVEDWQFITFLIKHQIFKQDTILEQINNLETGEQIRGLAHVALEHNMSAELLRDLLPCGIYGPLFFPAFVEMLSLPYCREMIIVYFRQGDCRFFNDSIAKQTLRGFFKIVTAQVVLEDWALVTFFAQTGILSSVAGLALSKHRKISESLKELVDVALEHNMSAELLRDLLPCVYFGHLVFHALAKGFDLPHYRETMIAYFRSEEWHNDVTFHIAACRFANFLTGLTDRIAVEDWEFVTFVIQNDLTPAYKSLLDCRQIYECAKDLVRVALEHKMSPELLKHLLPCVNYGHLVFPALASGFTLSCSRQVMLIYFRSEQLCLDVAREMVRTISEPVDVPHQDGNSFDEFNEFGRQQHIIDYLQDEEIDLWYVFGGSVQIQFIWVRQFAKSSIKRLNPVLTREICEYLV